MDHDNCDSGVCYLDTSSTTEVEVSYTLPGSEWQRLMISRDPDGSIPEVKVLREHHPAYLRHATTIVVMPARFYHRA